jgi:hypothetical protein
MCIPQSCTFGSSSTEACSIVTGCTKK